MNGSGTKDEPYIVTNWDELFEACANPNKYVNLDVDLDGNDYNNGIWDKMITLECKLLDGKNHTIKNIYAAVEGGIITKSYIISSEIINLNFENILALGAFSTGESITYENCNLTVNCSLICSDYSGQGAVFKYCSIYFGTSLGYCTDASFEHCNVYIKILDSGYSNNVNSGASNWAIFKSAVDSRIEIYAPFKCLFGWDNYSSADNTRRQVWFLSTFSGCVLSIKSDDPESEVVWVEDYNISKSKQSIINISGIKHIRRLLNGSEYSLENIKEGDTANNGTIFLSEANMKNKAYLNSIGFAVE